MTVRRTSALFALGALVLVGCGGSGPDAEAEQAQLAPLPTVGGVGVLPVAVASDHDPLVVVTRPINDDGTAAALVGETVAGNRLLMIGDSILASTATRYSGYMCDTLAPLGWAVDVEAEPSRFIDFGNRVLDKRLDPARGDDYDWDAAAVFLGSNYGGDQERYERELRLILARLAPRPTLLYTVTEYRPNWAEVNDVIRKLAGEFDNVTVVDWQLFATTPGVLSSDRLHPTNDGRRVLVDLTAAALGPATIGEGECLKSEFTDDSAVGHGSANTPASRPSAGGSSGGRSSPATTHKPVTPTPGGSTTVAGSAAPSSTSPSIPPSTTAPTTVPTTTATTTAPTTTAPTTTAPTTTATNPPPVDTAASSDTAIPG